MLTIVKCALGHKNLSSLSLIVRYPPVLINVFGQQTKKQLFTTHWQNKNYKCISVLLNTLK